MKPNSSGHSNVAKEGYEVELIEKSKMKFSPFYVKLTLAKSNSEEIKSA